LISTKLKLLLASALLTAGTAQAAILTYEYTAVIDTLQKTTESDGDHGVMVDVNSTSLVFGQPITKSEVVHGQIKFDTNSWINPYYSTPTATNYSSFFNLPYIEFAAGSFGHKVPYGYTGFVNVKNTPTGDEFNTSFSLSSGWGGRSLGLSFTDPTGSVFSSTQIPTSLNLSDFASANFFFSYADNGYLTRVEVGGHLTSLQLISAPVPEPTTISMLLAGMGLIGVAARKKRRQQ
jgi:hypothetical protein